MYNGNHMEQLRTKVESLFVQSTDPVVKPDDVELERLVENLELPKRSRKFGISTDRIKVLSNAKNTETQRASRSQKLVGDALEDEAKKEGQASAE